MFLICCFIFKFNCGDIFLLKCALQKCHAELECASLCVEAWMGYIGKYRKCGVGFIQIIVSLIINITLLGIGTE